MTEETTVHPDDEDELDAAPLDDEDEVDAADIADTPSAGDPDDLSDEQSDVAYDDGADVAAVNEPQRPEGGIVPDPPDDAED